MAEHPLRRPLLQVGLKRFKGEFAGGQRANNKLNLGADDLREYLSLRFLITGEWNRVIDEHGYEPDLILSVPYGADGHGEQLALSRGIAYARLGKDLITGGIMYLPGSQEAVEASQGIALAEDVPNKLTTVRKVLALPGIGERVLAVLGIFDRGNPAERIPLNVPLHSIISEHIPAMLPDDSPYWQEAGLAT